jgi:hypothetical protein
MPFPPSGDRSAVALPTAPRASPGTAAWPTHVRGGCGGLAVGTVDDGERRECRLPPSWDRAQRGPFWRSTRRRCWLKNHHGSVPPLGSAGSTGLQGPPGRGYEIHPTWLPAAGCRPGSGRSPGTRWPAGAARAAGAEPRGRCPAGALVGSGRGYQRLAQTDHVIIAGVRVARAAGPRCGPGPPGRRPGPLPSRPGGAGGSSTQRRGQVHVAVSPVLDPLAELQRGHGRFLCWSARAKARPA